MKKTNKTMTDAIPLLLLGLEEAASKAPLISKPATDKVETSESSAPPVARYIDAEKVLSDAKKCYQGLKVIESHTAEVKSQLRGCQSKVLISRVKLGRLLMLAKVTAPHGQFETLRQRILPELPTRTASQLQMLFRVISSTEEFEIPNRNNYLKNPGLLEKWTDKAIEEEFKGFSSIQQYARRQTYPRRSVFNHLLQSGTRLGLNATKLVRQALEEYKSKNWISPKLVSDIEKILDPISEKDQSDMNEGGK